ncbi:hypothetical protein BDR05DRAFT_953718 [Suillus weaverae]|nr:hypothetical protein BDR05DRAFT_953718 [Suillus weaverae]
MPRSLSPRAKTIATAVGRFNEDGIKIWDANFKDRIKHDRSAYRRVSIGLIDCTATWRQMAVLEGHTNFVDQHVSGLNSTNKRLFNFCRAPARGGRGAPSSRLPLLRMKHSLVSTSWAASTTNVQDVFKRVMGKDLELKKRESDAEQ